MKKTPQMTNLELRILRLAKRYAASGTKESFISAMVLIEELSSGNGTIGLAFWGVEQNSFPGLKSLGKCEIDDYGEQLVSGIHAKYWEVSEDQASEYCDRLAVLISGLLSH